MRSLSTREVHAFLGLAAEMTNYLAWRPRAGEGWRHLSGLVGAAQVAPASRIRIARQAAERCRAHGRDTAYDRALGAWYRALALVLFAGARSKRAAPVSP